MESTEEGIALELTLKVVDRTFEAQNLSLHAQEGYGNWRLVSLSLLIWGWGELEPSKI